MASAKLIKSLEKYGFFLNFPEYERPEDMIIAILKEKNPRISLSLPLFLMEDIDYEKICSKISFSQKKDLNKAILISGRIYKSKKIKSNLKEIIEENHIKGSFSKEEFQEFYDAFNDSQLNLEKANEKKIENQSKIRLNLNLNRDLRTLFSPAKIRIMYKIYNHEKLTNTELKYYYKSISNINKSVLNPLVQDYLKVIELTKKEVLK